MIKPDQVDWSDFKYDQTKSRKTWVSSSIIKPDWGNLSMIKSKQERLKWVRV